MHGIGDITEKNEPLLVKLWHVIPILEDFVC